MHGYRPLARRPEIINRYHVQIVHLFKSNWEMKEENHYGFLF